MTLWPNRGVVVVQGSREHYLGPIVLVRGCLYFRSGLIQGNNKVFLLERVSISGMALLGGNLY